MLQAMTVCGGLELKARYLGLATQRRVRFADLAEKDVIAVA